jgi:hypothetical protein
MQEGEKSVNRGGQCLNLNVHLALYLTMILEINSFIMNILKPYSARNRNWFLHSSQFWNRITVLCTNGMAAHVYHNMWEVSSNSYSCYDQHETHNIWWCSMYVCIYGWLDVCLYVRGD